MMKEVKVLLRYWFIEHNPFYIFSVLLMFCGLYLANTAITQSGKESVNQLLFFFTIQNVYEILIILMAVYLLKKKIQPEQGLALILFSCFFMTDITMYQMRIAGCGEQYGKWLCYSVAAIYFSLAVFKVLYIILKLKITINPECLFFILSGILFIYSMPLILDYFVTTMATQSSFGWWEIYLIWLLAAMIQLPLIVRNWKNQPLSRVENGHYLEDNNLIYKILLIIPLFVIPFQLIYNTHADLKIINPDLNEMLYSIIPYLVCMIFFLESLYHNYIVKALEQYIYDFLPLLFLVIISFGLRTENVDIFKGVRFTPFYFNLIVILIAQMALAVTRRNKFSCAFVAIAIIWSSQNMLRYLYDNFVSSMHYMYAIIIRLIKATTFFVKNLSRITIAIIMIISSFAALGLGFVFSLKSEIVEATD